MVDDHAPEARLPVTLYDRVGILIGHDVPFIEKGNESADIEFDLFGSWSAAHCNMIIVPSLLVVFASQNLQEFGKVLCVSGIGHISVVAIVDAIV